MRCQRALRAARCVLLERQSRKAGPCQVHLSEPQRRPTAVGWVVESVEVARAVAFLVSRDAAAITGVNLAADCGWLVSGSR
ncbi:MAG TPA: SDR family oxidoreductase [Burkholderiales bacterium]|nr:SDR family oxidoreductase [Burkholderiales bacterium]